MTAVPNEPFLSVAVRCFVVGAVVTAVVNAVWWLVAGGPMPWWATGGHRWHGAVRGLWEEHLLEVSGAFADGGTP